MVNFRQGEDLILEIQVLNNENVKVDLSLASKIRVGFNIKNLVVQKYLDPLLENQLPDYGDVFINATDSTKLDVYVTREQSRDFPIGQLSATVLIEIFDTSLEGIVDEYTYIIGNVLKGYLKDEQLTI